MTEKSAGAAGKGGSGITPTAQEDSSAAVESPTEHFSPAYANYVLGILFTVYVINFIDRQVMSVFIGPIKEEFGVSDTAMGFLVGFSFALFYSLAGIPIARWADRSNRRTIIAIGLALWSAMTLASGLARNFVQLALARVGVGVGEAAGTPPAHSLISDYFPPEKRGTALGIYSSGVYVGSAIAYLCGGYMRANFDWRLAFIVLGIPGLLFALVVRYTVREPPRGMSERHRTDTQQTTLKETLAHLFGCRTWVYMILGASCLSITGYGALLWGYEFYIRVHRLDEVEIGIWMAAIVGFGGSIGVYAGGRLVDYFGPRDNRWFLRLPALVNLAILPTGLIFILSDSTLLSLLFFFPFYLLANFYIPAMHTVNLSLAKLRMRSTASAIIFFAISIVGAGLGPFLVGALSDLFTARFGQEAIRYSLISVVVIGLFGSLFFHLASRCLAADLSRLGVRITAD